MNRPHRNQGQVWGSANLEARGGRPLGCGFDFGVLASSQRALMERKCDRSVGWWERKWSQSHKRLSICGRHEACQPSIGHVVMWEGAGMPLRFLTITNKKEKRPPHICWDTRGFVWHHSQVLRGETAQLDPPGESCCQREARERPGARAHWRRPILQGILVLLQLSLSNSTLLTFGAG